MTAFTFGQRTDTTPRVKVDRSPDAFQVCANLLLDMAWAGDEVGVEEARANRIIARIERFEETYPVGTPERGEAESMVASLRASAKRKRAQIVKIAKRFAATWPEMNESHQQLFLSSMSGKDYIDNPMWPAIRTDTVGNDPVWAALHAARSVNREEVPF